MRDSILDTNVLIVGSLAASARSDESHRSAQECETVYAWLMAFAESPGAVVLDEQYKIWDEYNNKLTGQDLGLLVVTQKLERDLCRLHPIEYEPDDGATAVVPESFAALDRSDRKFLAVALADKDAGHDSIIVNATDTEDWRAIEPVCGEHGVEIVHLLD